MVIFVAEEARRFAGSADLRAWLASRRPLALVAASSLAFSSPAIAQSGAASVEMFETGVPAGMTAQRGALSTSPEHRKDGLRSLKWSFESGGTLTIRRDFEFIPFIPNSTDQRRRGIALWIYNPAAREGSFRFDFYRGAVRATRFTMKANFVGWRAAVVAYETDMLGKPVSGMDRLVMSVPRGAHLGEVYLDQLGFDMLIDPRHPAADYQLPTLNAGVGNKANSHWTAVLQYDRLLAAAQSRPGPRSSATAQRDVEAIERRIDADLLARRAPSLASIESDFRDLHNADGSLKSLAETSQQWMMYRSSGVSPATLKSLRASSITWRELGEFLRRVAVAYRLSRDSAESQRLQAMFLEVVRHQIDQGLIRGSGQGILHHQGYQLGDWTEALFLMRDSLGDQAEIVRESIAWFVGLGRIYEPFRADTDFNADVANTLLEPMLFAILMDRDRPRRDAAMAELSDWIGKLATRSPGTGGGIKADGSVFHHSQHYVAYGNGALTGLTATLYFLSGTEFRVASPAHERIRHAVLMTRLLSNQTLIPLSLSGRHLDGEQAIAVSPFRNMALAGNPDGTPGPDSQIAQAFLRLMQARARDAGGKPNRASEADRATAKELRRNGFAPEADPQGSWTMNYSSLVLHRRDGWMLAARGFSRYLVGNESYESKNLFGRYVNYGAIELIPADAAQRGYSRAGWDWTRWPGTTAAHVPLERLKARVAQVDEVAGVEEMLLSEQTYSGGLDFRGKQAMFAMKLQGHPKYGDDLTARKSAFFFENRVIALGSGISSSDPVSPVQTTVFQDRISEGRGPSSLDGISSRNVVQETRLDLEGWTAAIGERGDGFCIAPGQSVIFSRGEQISLDETGETRTNGQFATLVLDHGISPSAGGYEYALLVGGGGQATQALCKAMGSAQTAPYVVLERDQRAHVVSDVATGITGYALFEPGRLKTDGLLLSASAPSMVMLRQSLDRVEGSFTNPDLNFYQGKDPKQYDAEGRLCERSVYALPWRMSPSKPVRTTLAFKGQWRLDHPMRNVSVRFDARSERTLATFDSVEASPIQFTLVKE